MNQPIEDDDFMSPRDREYFFLGYKEAVLSFGKWKDGVQVIGLLDTPVKEILADLKNKLELE